jgi:Chromo (CHRromatin Organisation MOdifier) domain
MFLENQKDWKMWLPILQFALNDAVSASTGETPHKATFGINRKNVWIDEKDEVKLSEKLRNLHNQISMEIKWNHEQAKRYFDKRRVEAPNLKRGDRVYLRRRTKGNTRDNIFTKKESSKLDMILLGPFEIKKVLEFDNYELWLPPKMRIHPVFHISLLKPTKNEPTKENMELEEFEVEKLIDKRIQKGQTQYRVRWKGFDEKDDTWEPRKNLNCPEKVQEFERSSEAEEPLLRKLVYAFLFPRATLCPLVQLKTFPLNLKESSIEPQNPSV